MDSTSFFPKNTQSGADISFQSTSPEMTFTTAMNHSTEASPTFINDTSNASGDIAKRHQRLASTSQVKAPWTANAAAFSLSEASNRQNRAISFFNQDNVRRNGTSSSIQHAVPVTLGVGSQSNESHVQKDLAQKRKRQQYRGKDLVSYHKADLIGIQTEKRQKIRNCVPDQQLDGLDDIFELLDAAVAERSDDFQALLLEESNCIDELISSSNDSSSLSGNNEVSFFDGLDF